MVRFCRGIRRSQFALLTGFAAILVALAAPDSSANVVEDHMGLTRESFRRNCLMCHSKAAPEGVSAEIMSGLTPVPGLKPFDAMPGLICWRRCEDCKLPAPARKRPEK